MEQFKDNSKIPTISWEPNQNKGDQGQFNGVDMNKNDENNHNIVHNTLCTRNNV